MSNGLHGLMLRSISLCGWFIGIFWLACELQEMYTSCVVSLKTMHINCAASDSLFIGLDLIKFLRHHVEPPITVYELQSSGSHPEFKIKLRNFNDQNPTNHMTPMAPSKHSIPHGLTSSKPYRPQNLSNHVAQMVPSEPSKPHGSDGFIKSF